MPLLPGQYHPLLLIVVTVLVPPLGVFIHTGLSQAFWVNLVLTLLFYVPGLIHALWVLFQPATPAL